MDDSPWSPYRNFNPDQNPSASGWEIVDRADTATWLLPVRGLGFLVMKAVYADPDPKTGRRTLELKGTSLVLAGELEYTELLRGPGFAESGGVESIVAAPRTVPTDAAAGVKAR